MNARKRQTMLQGANDKFYRSVQLDGHNTVVGEPCEYCLNPFSPAEGKGRILAEEQLA